MPVLYRKYRPKKFSEVVGQEHIVKTLVNAISMKILSHAYLFYGARGIGKTTFARLLAKAVNCERNNKSDARNSNSGNYEPCNQCSSCLEINKGQSIDLIEIDAASNRGIDEMRNLREKIGIAPAKSKYKIYVIDECHQLTKEASNALLKTLEEPPEHAIFILCTTEFSKILPTISSRCQRFEFKKSTLPQIVEKIGFICSKEGVKAKQDVLELIARMADGSMRDAESLLDEVINFEQKEIKKEEVEDILGIVAVEFIAKLVDFLLKKDEKGAIEYLNQFLQGGVDAENFIKKLISYLRDLFLVKINSHIFDKNTIFTKEEEINLKRQEGDFSEECLRKTIKIFLEAKNQVKWSDLPQLPIELAIMDSIEVINAGNQ